jgi:hypothetical protein
MKITNSQKNLNISTNIKNSPWMKTSGFKETACSEKRGCMVALTYTDFVLFYYSKEH